jgi:nitrogen fixation protein NifU and related proteins
MYSTKVLEHLENPRNVGEMSDATVRGEAENPVCGDVLHLYLKLEGEMISAATFQAKGCPPTLAASSVLTEVVSGMSVSAARGLKAADITAALESLPRNKEHCSVLAIDALRAALRSIPRSD